MASSSKRKAKELQSYLISYIMEDEENSAICEIDNDKKSGQSKKPLNKTIGAEKKNTNDSNNASSKLKSTENIVLGEIGSCYMDQNGNFYLQTSEHCLEQILEKPANVTELKKFTLPSIPKDKLPAETETIKKPNTRTSKKSTDTKEKKEDEDKRIMYFFMLKSKDDDEEDDMDTLLAQESANASYHDNHRLIQVIVNKNMIVDAELKSHIYACNYCNYSTYRAFALSKHVRRHTLSVQFNCSVCKRSFKTKASLNNHVNAHMGVKPHDCKFCSMSFTTAGEVVRHTRYKHTREKPHKCPDCDYCSVELSKLRRHIRSHTGERPYQCPHCTYASPDTFKLKRHLRTHTGEKPYECDICLARFTQSNSLKSHRLVHSVGEKPVFQCEYCPTTCGRKTDLRAHVFYLHTSDKPIPCKRCTQQFPDRWTYKVHLKTHIGEKSFKCKICPYASTSQRHLDSHMMVHQGIKPFVCKLCNASFRQTALLKRHMNLYHTTDYKAPEPKEKLHACPHCNKRFTHNGNLIRHMEMHDPSLNIMKIKKELQDGRKALINTDETITNSLDKGSSAEEGGEEEEEAEYFFIDEVNTDEKSEDKQFIKWEPNEEDDVIKYEFDSKDLTLRPVKSAKRSAETRSSSNIKTIIIDENCESAETDHKAENSKIMVLRLIDCPDDESLGADSDVKFTKTAGSETASKSCLSYKIEFDDDDDAII